MNIEEIASTMLNGEPVHDGLVIGAVFIFFYTFYKCILSGLFSIFKK